MSMRTQGNVFKNLGKLNQRMEKKSYSVSDIPKLNLKCIYFSLIRECEEGVVGLITDGANNNH